MDDDSNIEDMEPFMYTCQNPTLTYRDAKIECNLLAPNIMPSSLKVQVLANGYTTDFVLLSEYVQ